MKKIDSVIQALLFRYTMAGNGSDKKSDIPVEGVHGENPDRALSIPDYILDLLLEIRKDGIKYELPLGEDDKEDLFEPARLLRRKLLETRDRYIEARHAVREEIEADTAAFLEAALHGGFLAYSAAACGVALITIFKLKELEVGQGLRIPNLKNMKLRDLIFSKPQQEKLDQVALLEGEFKQTLHIWAAYQKKWKETNSLDAALKHLNDKMRASGLMFAGINPKIDSANFKTAEFQGWARQMGVVPGESRSLKQRVYAAGKWLASPENARDLVVSAYVGLSGYLRAAWKSCVYNYKPSVLKETFLTACRGSKFVARTAREFEWLSSKHKEAYTSAFPHDELRKEHPDAAKISKDPIAQAFINREYNSVRQALRERVTVTKIRAATVVFANSFWVFNFGMFATNAYAVMRGDTSMLPWVVANIWSLNRSMGPIRDIAESLVHDFAVIESKRARMVETKDAISGMMKKPPPLPPPDVSAP